MGDETPHKIGYSSAPAKLVVELFEDQMKVQEQSLTVYWVEVSVKYSLNKDHVEKEVLQQSPKVESKKMAQMFYDNMKAGYGI